MVPGQHLNSAPIDLEFRSLVPKGQRDISKMINRQLESGDGPGEGGS